MAHPQQEACTAGTCLQHRLNSLHLITCWSQCKDDCNQEQGVSNCFDYDRPLIILVGICIQCKGEISWRAPAFYGQRPRNFVTPLADALKDPLSIVFVSPETPGVSGNEARLPSLFCRPPTFHPHMPRSIQQLILAQQFRQVLRTQCHCHSLACSGHHRPKPVVGSRIHRQAGPWLSAQGTFLQLEF